MLSQKSIREFQAIWKEVYGEEISPQFAHERAEWLINLVRAGLDLPNLSIT